MKIKNNVKKIILVFNLLVFTLIAPVTANATTLENSKAVTGTVALLNDIAKVVLVLSATATGVLEAVQFFKMQTADDETDTKPIKKKMKIIAICGIGIIVVSGISTIVLSYYK